MVENTTELGKMENSTARECIFQWEVKEEKGNGKTEKGFDG